ncbi:MAG: GumC family protein [Cyclobacteriaceae bacterium]
MASQENINIVANEVNLKTLFTNILRRKFFLAISLLSCLAIAFVYIQFATPIYHVSTSLIIDPSGKSRMLGDSKYVEGGVGLIGTEKNLFNEISIIKSHSLIKQTLTDLPFEVSYYSKGWFNKKEHFGYFPIEVELLDSSAQLFKTPIHIEILSDQKYRINIEANDFLVSNPSTSTTHEVNQDFVFTEVHSFGTPVIHDYFTFIVRRPEYKVVLENFGDEDLFFEINDIGSLTQSYLDNLQIDQVDIQASILNVSIEGPIVEKEKAFLEKLCYNYINNKLLERNEIALSKELFIKDQLVAISDSLNKAERNLESFQRSAGAVNLTATATNALSEVQKLQSERSQMDLNINYYNSLLTYLSDSTNSEKIVAPSVVGIEDPLLNENLLELRRLYAKKNQPFYNGEGGLSFLNTQIQNTTRTIQENLRNLIQSSQSAVGNINYRMSIQDRIIDQLPGEEKQLIGFQRKRVLYDNLFNYLSQELAKTGIARAEDIPDTRVLDEPRMIGGKPIEPQKTIILLLAAIIGLIIPVGWIVFFDSFEPTIRSRNQLEACSDIPIAASIAHYESGSRLFKKDNTDWRVEESFRDLSAGLQFLIPDKKKNIIGVTSTVPDEGKTFVATNLAMSLAKSGKKVLIIDSDFRNPSTTRNIVLDEGKDLADFLRGNIHSVTEITHAYAEVDNLYFSPTFL